MSDGKFTRRTALGFIGAGGALVVSETFGFTNVTAGRGISVNASDDPNAILGIEGITDPSITPTFMNQSGNPMEITLDSGDVEFDVGDNRTWDSPPVTFSLVVNEARKTNIRFTGECADAGTATVDISADLTDDSGTTVGSITLTRNFEIPQSGHVQFNGTVDSAGASGKYSFDIENTGCEDVTFSEIRIDETTTDATRVSSGGSLSADGEEVVSEEILIDSQNPSSDTRYDMNPAITVPVNNTVSFEFDSFQRDGNGNGNGNNKVDMRGEDVRVTLYFGDGSSAVIELCLDGCEF